MFVYWGKFVYKIFVDQNIYFFIEMLWIERLNSDGQ